MDNQISTLTTQLRNAMNNLSEILGPKFDLDNHQRTIDILKDAQVEIKAALKTLEPIHKIGIDKNAKLEVLVEKIKKEINTASLTAEEIKSYL